MPAARESVVVEHKSLIFLTVTQPILTGWFAGPSVSSMYCFSAQVVLIAFASDSFSALRKRNQYQLLG